ncbi:hypothetical protein NLJ89_g1500 [Agrocybe chaxingu]|uniref:Uncharacterized protein n=1 Tax=Agrocybe chaxingu TaxID=84603 RepID=A0A9W8MZY2_9AGAR|nr:hypothetical protein NLJ89_g1500 [Agrocybe chaxingu]
MLLATVISKPHWDTRTPTLQTPKPTQFYPDAKYQLLLNNTHWQEPPSRTDTPLSNSSTTGRSTAPSPSSTLCTHSLSRQDVSKFFMDPHLLQTTVLSPSRLLCHDRLSAPINFEIRSPVEYLNAQSRSESLILPTTEQPSAQSLHNHEGWMPSRPLLHSPNTSPYMKLKKSWDHVFQSGCKSLGPIKRSAHAKELVWRGTWDDDTILDLARAFIWRASDFEAREPVNFIALFAAEVSGAFMQQRIPDERFNYVLREALMNAITGCWHVPRDAHGDPLPTRGHRPVMLDRNPTVDYKRHVRQAVALYGFAGCLYKHGQLPRVDVTHCIRVIFLNAKVAEHLHAIELILTSAGTKLWEEAADLTTEVQRVTAEINKLKHKIMDAWVLYLPRGGTKKKIEQLIVLVEDFAAKVSSDKRASAQVQRCGLHGPS